jgi:Na+/proline symporter
MIYAVSLGVALLALIVIGIFRPKDSDYYLGKGNYGTFSTTTGILASLIGGSITLNLIGLAREYGLYAFFDLLPTSLALLLLAFFSNKERSLAFFEGSRYKTNFGVILHHTVIFLLYYLVINLQIVAIRSIGPFLPIDVNLAIIIIVAAIWLYSFKGYSMVVVTDRLQLTFMIIFLYGVLLITSLFSDDISRRIFTVASEYKAMPLTTILSLFLFFFFIPVSQEVHQRIVSAKNDLVVKKSLVASGLLYISLGAIIILTTIKYDLDGFGGILAFVSHPIFATALFIAISMAIISTIDTSVNIINHSFSRVVEDRIGVIYPPVVSLIVFALATMTSLLFPTILSALLLAVYVYISGPGFASLCNILMLDEKTTVKVSMLAIGIHIINNLSQHGMVQLISLLVILSQLFYIAWNWNSNRRHYV